ncbi:uncharacterized protein [Emydura macquarii macquarii]|uniref:uncharacterized protein n=1 Tax=Emydura macquarii macquarii TaxID=1129001 RepID=UPI00352B26B6
MFRRLKRSGCTSKVKGDALKPPGLAEKSLLRQVSESLGSDPWLSGAVPMPHQENCLNDLLLKYQEGYSPRKEQMTCAAMWVMYQAGVKLLAELNGLECTQETFEQELEKVKVQNESMRQDLQTALTRNLTSAQQMTALTWNSEALEEAVLIQEQRREKLRQNALQYWGAVSVLTDQVEKPGRTIKEDHKKCASVISKLTQTLMAHKTICSVALGENPWDDQDWENALEEWQREKDQEIWEQEHHMQQAIPSASPPPYDGDSKKKEGRKVNESMDPRRSMLGSLPLLVAGWISCNMVTGPLTVKPVLATKRRSQNVKLLNLCAQYCCTLEQTKERPSVCTRLPLRPLPVHRESDGVHTHASPRGKKNIVESVHSALPGRRIL